MSTTNAPTTNSAASTSPQPNQRPPLIHIADPDAPLLLCAADHPAEPVRWLWPGRIPLGKITLLAGDPGLGKSLLALDVAARVTRGSVFPDEEERQGDDDRQGDKESGRQGDSPTTPSLSLSPCLPLSLSGSLTNTNPTPHRATPGSVLILSATDTLSDTIRPRLDAIGADPNRVFVVPNITDLRRDFDKLRDAVSSLPDCRLIIIDPINYYVGQGDSHFQTVVRGVLEPLAELARRKGLAILAITHLRKNDGAALQRAAGSMGFVATARTIWTLAQDHNDPHRRLLVPLKNNLGPTAPALAFRIETSPNPNPNACDVASHDRHPINDSPPPNPQSEIPNPQFPRAPSAPRILWDPNPITISPRDALRATPKPPPRPNERDDARDFLRAALADGPRPAGELIELGDNRGLHRRTIQRAFHDLEGHTSKRGWSAGWWWSLGDYPVDPPRGAEVDHLAPFSYATDVAERIRFDEFVAELDRRPPLRPTTADLSPSHDVSPSTNPGTIPLPPHAAQQSPSGNQSPSLPQAFSRPPSPSTSPPTLAESMAFFDRIDRNRHPRPPKPHPK